MSVRPLVFACLGLASLACRDRPSGAGPAPVDSARSARVVASTASTAVPTEILASRVETWKRAMQPIASASPPSPACDKAAVAALIEGASTLPVVHQRELSGDLPVGPALHDWRPMGLVVTPRTSERQVSALEARRAILLVVPRVQEEPELLLDKRFKSGVFEGKLLLVDTARKSAVCSAPLAFKSSAEVRTVDFGAGLGGPGVDLARDFRDEGTRALFLAARAMHPALRPDLPSMTTETTRAIERKAFGASK